MRKLQTALQFYNYLKEHQKTTILSSSLVFIAGSIILSFGVNQILNVLNTWLSSEVLIGTPFNLLFSNLLIATLTIILSMPIFAISYLMIESHFIGIKLLFPTAAILAGLAIYGKSNFELTITASLLCALAAAINLVRRRTTGLNLDSPAVTENAVKFGLRLSGFICVGILIGMFAYITARGIAYVNWDFLTGKWDVVHAKDVLAGEISGPIGGISDSITGSLLLVSLCEAIAIPLGLGAAVFLAEYASENKFTNTIRFFIETLAGAPSIVIGLLGLSLLVTQLGMQRSLLAGSISLAFMILPWNIRIAEEAMRAVPQSYREASYAIGATKWQTIKNLVLYASSPGILTGILLGLGAALGETAVVMLAAGDYPVTAMPRNLALTGTPIPSLAVWIYGAFRNLTPLHGSGADTVNWEAQNVCLAGAFVLILMFLVICIAALVVRNYLSKKISGK